MARIAVIGGTGYAGSNIVAEAVSRGHTVVSVARGVAADRIEGATYIEGTLLDVPGLVAELQGVDVVVCAVPARGDMLGNVRSNVAQLVAELPGDVRIGVIGGAGGSLIEPDGERLIDQPSFTEEYKPEALEAIRRGRGERWVEGTFGLHARHQGNGVGYDSICASGDHANTLHWVRNDGDLRPGELILIDAGIEVDSLYTADITRTLPISGTFSPAQRRVYQAVLEAQDAAAAVAKVGHDHAEIHQAAIRVICEYLHEWGILPVSVEESLSPEGGQHRRWMVHGTSHHLGLDVHDCNQARRQDYSGPLKKGMCVSDEPGIYFKQTDLLVPEEFRGIGVRIEDDLCITDGEPEWLSKDCPRQVDEIEAWMQEIWGRACH